MIIREPITKVLFKPDAIFDIERITAEIKVSNFQSIKFVIATGAGTSKTVNAQILATKSSGGVNEVIIEERTISIGDGAVTSFLVNSNSLAHIEYDSVYLKIANASDTDIFGCVFAVIVDERYSTDAREIS